MTCRSCGKEAFTIRGRCEDCDPELHEADRTAMAYISEVEYIYTAETGKRALQSWHEFEAWMERRPKLSAVLATKLQRCEAARAEGDGNR
jgi:predicted ATP-dependent serine protease